MVFKDRGTLLEIPTQNDGYATERLIAVAYRLERSINALQLVGSHH
jgi:hypothetical protein